VATFLAIFQPIRPSPTLTPLWEKSFSLARAAGEGWGEGRPMFEQWKTKARQLKTETYALYLAYRHPGVPWYAKVFSACIVAYLFSPIDLIPDFIPILGYLDDLILVPLGILLALKMIPDDVWQECKEEAINTMRQDLPSNRAAAGVIIAIWLLLFSLALWFVFIRWNS
jgi:uncharacterized membrane protein YkvA (DUF1232 family)